MSQADWKLRLLIKKIDCITEIFEFHKRKDIKVSSKKLNIIEVLELKPNY